MMKSISLAIMFLVFPAIAFSQSDMSQESRITKEDSLITVFSEAREDSTKRKTLDEIFFLYIQDPTKTSEDNLRRIDSLIRKKGVPNLDHKLIMYRIFLTHTTDSIVETRIAVQKLLKESQRVDDNDSYLWGLIVLSQKEKDIGNYNEAQKILLHTLDYARDTLKNKSQVGGTYLSLAILYYEQHDTLKAIEFNKIALKTLSETTDTLNMASVSNNLAMQYSDLKLYDSAIVYFHKSISLFLQADDKFILANPYSNLALVYRLTNDYDSAFYYARLSIQNAIELNYDDGLSGAYFVLAQTYRDMGQTDSAAVYYQLTKEIIERINTPFALRDFYPDLAAFYASQGNFKDAYEYLHKAAVIKDNIFNQENSKVLKEMDAKYQTGEKEKALLKQEGQIKRQRILTFAMFAVSVFFLLLLFFIFRSFRLKQKSNKLLAIAKEKAEQSEKFKQQFLANMSHEIRTPMNAVMGMTNLLIEKNPREDQVRYLQGIQKSSDTLLHIINDILDLSKIEAGKISLENIAFSIHDVVDQVRQTLLHKADEKGLELISFIDPEVPEVVIGDPTRLNQVLMNLAGNAIKFTEKGSVAIEIRNTLEAYVRRFSIIDTGIGIASDKLQSVFDSFSQANSSDTRKFGGTGLGLTISRQLVELMGGKINIESELGAGTTFSFDIYYPVGSKEKLNELASTRILDGSVLNGLKILIVDDNEYNRIVAHDTLMSKSRLEITQAVNGQDGIDKAKQNDFDVILMDVQMPVMNGYEATQYIREKFDPPKNKIPIIALTASVVRSDLDKCRAAGMSDYVPKPFKVSQLITAIAKATGRELNPISYPNEFIKPEITNSKPAVLGRESTITNLAYLEKFCEGDEKQMQKYITMFTSSAPLLIEKMNSALAESDFESIANQVHGYKTKWIMMGMNETKELALIIEQQCREAVLELSIKDNVAKLIGQIHTATKELNRA